MKDRHLRRHDARPAAPAASRRNAADTGRRLLEDVITTSSRPLDSAARRFTDARFGRDLSGVPSHTPSTAAPSGPILVNAPSDAAEREAEQAESSTPALDRPARVDPASVRIHTGPKAAELAETLNARAFTYGPHIVFARDQFAPETPAGQSLLAHELTHVLQQARGTRAIQRKEIPQSLKSSANVATMSEAELHARYDLIVQTLSEFNESTADTAMLDEEAGRIGHELSRREALREGRTFTPDDIEKMKKYFQANVRKPKPRNCIDTMNDGLTKLFGDPQQKMGDAVNKTMGALQASGRAGEARTIPFEDKKGRVSKSGAGYPERPHESVWDALMQMAGGDVGWSVFGLGPADMSHSVTLTLDNTDPSKPVVYWSDQWKGKGWKPLDRAGLDAEVASVTQFIWNKKDERHKPDTHVTLWRLKRNVAPPAGTP
jgi:hypothetical protein